MASMMEDYGWDGEELDGLYLSQAWRVMPQDTESDTTSHGTFEISGDVQSIGSSELENDDGSLLDCLDLGEKDKAKQRGRKKTTKPGERKEKMAAACRKFRAKRKLMMAELKEKNDRLEEEREVFLGRIAELQTEAQMLRDTGSVNMQKENELLKAEIRKHKAFIRTIVDATQSAPDITAEEKLRLLRSGCESALGQVQGLMYTSANDPNWKVGNSVKIGDHQIYLRYQYLPLGASIKDAKRLNIRVDYNFRPETPDALFFKMWNIYNDDDLLYEAISQHFPMGTEGFEWKGKEIFPDLQTENGVNWREEAIRVFHYIEKQKDEDPVDYIFACTHQEISVYPQAFPDSMVSKNDIGLPGVEADDKFSGPIPGMLIASSSGTAIHAHDEHFEPIGKNVKRVREPILEGSVILPRKDGKCHWTYISSFPLTKISYYGIKDLQAPIVDEEGNLSQEAVGICGAINAVIDSCSPVPDPPMYTENEIHLDNTFPAKEPTLAEVQAVFSSSKYEPKESV